MTKPFNIIVFISGNGSNLQAIIDAIASGLPAKILAVISNRGDAYGLERARKHHIPCHVIKPRSFPTREAFDDTLLSITQSYDPDLIVLAGFMRVLTPHFIQHSPIILNIHPALLPKYPGLDTYKRVLAAGDKFHGVTIHLVTEDVDSGPIIVQKKVEIGLKETPESLKAKVQKVEHQFYPAVIRLFAEGKIQFNNNRLYFNQIPIPSAGIDLQMFDKL